MAKPIKLKTQRLILRDEWEQLTTVTLYQRVPVEDSGK